MLLQAPEAAVFCGGTQPSVTTLLLLLNSFQINFLLALVQHLTPQLVWRGCRESQRVSCWVDKWLNVPASAQSTDFMGLFCLFVSEHIQISRTAKGDRDCTLIERGQSAACFSCINILCIFLFKPEGSVHCSLLAFRM